MQSLAYFNPPKFSVKGYETSPDKAAAYYQATVNLGNLRKLDRAAYDAMIARMDKGGETWQAVDVDVCRELERLEAKAQAEDENSMRMGY